MQVYLRERECSSFYLATANQRDEATRNRAEHGEITFLRTYGHEQRSATHESCEWTKPTKVHRATWAVYALQVYLRERE